MASKKRRQSHPKHKVQPKYYAVRKLVAGGQGPVIGKMVQKSELIYVVKMDEDKDHIWNVQWGDRGVWFNLPFDVQESSDEPGL